MSIPNLEELADLSVEEFFKEQKYLTFKQI